jgi:hypothetical protein
MKQSEVKALGKEIIDQIFPSLLKSPEKTDWQKAFAFIQKKIAELEAKARMPESDTHDIRELWAWNSCRRQLADRYGRKFIKPKLFLK